ncbi:Protein FAM169B [Sciurus carolinensis]|uniref:Protein FAM169B n=1 Tax=Sciurus carolinensis TaxID=30640 RepID=A0AA41MU35_SCICA|nr:Protein FAM169B [Sciurus carolinensis]
MSTCEAPVLPSERRSGRVLVSALRNFSSKNITALPTKNLLHPVWLHAFGTPWWLVCCDTIISSWFFSLVVAVYLKESWWSTEDVLRTSDPTREGLMKVQSFGERIVLFVLNVIIFGRLERSLDDDDMFFLPHSVKERAKILWRNGAAVGFYTTKVKGSSCGDGTGACSLLPVFDTVFVRRKHRRQGLGTAMLQDFCETFQEDDALGLSCPISSAMYQVCRQFLLAHPEERGRLWEVETLGARGQRVNIWLKVQQQARLPDGERQDQCPLD